MLQSSEGGDSLANLEKAAATLLDVAKRQDVVQDKLIEIAEWHLRVKRKLGSILVQVDHRGGDRAKCQAASLPNGGLPAGLNKSAAKRCRRLARIGESDFDAYVARTREIRRMPSAEAALKFAESTNDPGAPRKKVRRKPRSVHRDIEASPQTLDAIERCLGDIDVCVGRAQVKCRRRVAGAKLAASDLQGIVLVTARVDPEVWLNQVSQARQRAQCEQVVVLLPAETATSWFQRLSEADWHLCFLADWDAPTVAAYIGSRSEAFFAAMHDHGLVVRVHE